MVVWGLSDGEFCPPKLHYNRSICPLPFDGQPAVKTWRIVVKRRHFLKETLRVQQAILGTSILANWQTTFASATLQSSSLPQIRRITDGPKFHWRGYYDKLLFDTSNRYVLSNQVSFEHRSPEPNDRIQVGMIDLQSQSKWTELGSSNAWNWQQGCMLQWLPGDGPATILWNDRIDDQFVCHRLEIESGKRSTLPMAVYCVAPNGRWGLSVDFRRLNDCRPGYGYCGIPDPHASKATPSETGIWRVDFETGQTKLLLTYDQIAKLNYDEGIKFGFDPTKSKHWFNHLLINPTGDRFLFLHRWRETPPDASREKISKTGFSTRMITCDVDGSHPFVVDPYGKTSHFVWRDATSICAWAFHPSHRDRFYLFHDRSRTVEGVGVDVMTQNGHNTYVPMTDNQWILNDTYPDKGREQHPYLYHIPSNRRVDIASLLSPAPYTAEFRCDNHPCASRDGTKVILDSTHEGLGRQVYLIDIDEIIHPKV